MHELIRHYARSVYSLLRREFSKNFKIQKIIFTKNVDNPPVIIVIYVCKVIIHTDCPATFSTLCAGYCSAVGKHSGPFWAYSGRGRFGVFYEVLWIQVG